MYVESTIVRDNTGHRRLVDPKKLRPNLCIHRRPMVPGLGNEKVVLCPSCEGEADMLEAKVRGVEEE